MMPVSAEVSDAAHTPGNPDVPEAGQLVRVRGQQWVVSNVNSPANSPPTKWPRQGSPAGLSSPLRASVTMTSAGN